MVVFGHIGYIPANLFFSGKVVVIRQSGCNRAKWLCSVKVVVFGKIGCIPAKWFYSGRSCYVRANWLYPDKKGYIPESGCKWAKVFVFGQSGF